MRKTIVYLLLTVCCLLSTITPAFAHLPGQTPFFKINGMYSGLYPVASTSLSNFPLPQDIGPEMYMVNEPITFEIDKTKLPAPPELVDKTNFDWDFGDGTKGTGLKNTHVYKKSGSYHLVITTDFGQAGYAGQIFQTVLFHVLSSKNQKLPEVTVLLNGKKVSKQFMSEFQNKIQFDSLIKTYDGTIVSYFWDFGDEKTSNQKSDSHSYPKNYTVAFPLLRVVDSNGFIVDTSVELDNGKEQVTPTPEGTNNLKLSTFQIGGIIVAVIGILFVFLILKIRSRS